MRWLKALIPLIPLCILTVALISTRQASNSEVIVKLNYCSPCLTQCTVHTGSKDYWIVNLHLLSDKKSLKSQGAQDDYLETIFTKVGTTNKVFVEFGFNEPNYTSGGSGANTWNLYDHGWRGLLLDGDRENQEINLQKHFLFGNNIGEIFEKYKVTKELDYLSCDMDSHDLFVFKAILEAGYRPRVITTEYNSNYPLDYTITQLDPILLGDTTKDFNFNFKQCAWGASASAFRMVAENFSYTLIGRVGLLDLVWLRNDLLQANWEIPSFDWFFYNAPLGKLFHQSQTSHAVFESLIDYAVYERTGSIEEAKKIAIQQILSSNLPCFENISTEAL